MRVVVPVKYVPDIQSDRRLDSDGRVVREVREGTLNELDENAIETALRLVEALDDEARAASEVVAITVGPAEADLALRKSFQLGVDRGLRLTDPALSQSDYFSTARALAAMLRRDDLRADAVICGMAALDGLGSVVPALLSAELGWPQLLMARQLDVTGDVAGGTATAHIVRELDGASEELEAPLPAVISVTDHISTPRYPNVQLILAARTKPIGVLTLADVDLQPSDVGAAQARTRVVSASRRPQRDAVRVVDDGSGGIRLAQYLAQRGLV